MFPDIVRAIEKLPVDYDEWQIVYRKMLQLARVLNAKPQVLVGLIHREETMGRDVAWHPGNGRNGGPSTPHLVGEIGGRILELAQAEVELARAELASDVRSGRRTLLGLAIAAAAGLAGVNLLLVAVVLALTIVMPGWLAALVVAAVVLGAGATAGYVGWAQRPRSPLSLTRKSLKEDWEWLKAQLV